MTEEKQQLNVLGTELEPCGMNPVTGFYRDGCCNTGPNDVGTHTVCAVVTNEFLEFSKSRGNDLTTARPEFNFPGLKDGDKWCLCALRWKEALMRNVAPKVLLEATNEKTLNIINIEDLIAHSHKELKSND